MSAKEHDMVNTEKKGKKKRISEYLLATLVCAIIT